METPYHVPVLREASVRLLDVQPAGRYVDVTFGGGGHSRAILEKLGPEGQLMVFDQDPDAEQNLPQNATGEPNTRLRFEPANFRELQLSLNRAGWPPVDGILADLGVSSHQFDTPMRGFLFRQNATLDMRMNPEQLLSAREVINEYPEERLADLFYHFGELRGARRLAKAVAAARASKALDTTFDLVEAIEPLLPRTDRNSLLAQVFQAIRIEVNDELGALEALLAQSLEVLKPTGRLVVISYHSLEDRRVKHVFRTGNLAGDVKKDFFGRTLTPWEPITRKPIMPTEAEIAANPRSRSAKLRAAAKRPPEPPAAT